jgi:general stress protein 26
MGPGKSREFGCSDPLRMDPALKQEVVSVLNEADDLTIATVREDGYPQATTVSYVNAGLTIYFGCAAESQKAQNLARNGKVSLTVNLPYANWSEIRGLSIGGRAERVTDSQEIEQVAQLMFQKFPQIAPYAPTGLEGVVLFRVTPEIISVLDYRKGFGHTDLVNVAA